MGTVITVTSGKGGTGKTTVTGGVASCLARLGKNVLCIDMDIGLRNLDISLGLSDRALMDFADVALGNCPLARAAVSHPDLPNLSLLTAPHAPPAPRDGGQHPGAAAHGPGPVRLHFHRLPRRTGARLSAGHMRRRPGAGGGHQRRLLPAGRPAGPWRSCTACVRSIW